MEFVIKNAAPITVVFDGKKYNVTRPTLGQSRQLQADLKSAKDDAAKQDAIYFSLLETLGMPDTALAQMDTDALTALAEVLQPKKKK